MKIQRTLVAAVGAASLAFALAACSDDNETMDNNTEGTTATQTSEMDSADTTTETETDGEEASGNTIVDAAMGNPDFSTLVEALQAADLVETLQNDGPYTVFAPTNEAFAALPEGTLDELLADPSGDLTEILTYHVIPGEVMAADVMEMDGETVETLQGEMLTIQIDGDAVWLMDADGNTVQVTDPDMTASNGVIHAIDGVLMPMPADGDM
ncbi:fasciclin domain-containing protein [Corynebacterium sputi]|uniref:fasciclin domain-containing protein n=1 Tax=Corynebacterium sputi TaxID=489915 RepID=UPI000412E5DC|nr:fasciclin domain-containing protein [Corynebacterium sputi]